jgi:hypothetical protein
MRLMWARVKVALIIRLKHRSLISHITAYGLPIVKTTVDIADDLLKRSQQLAKREGSTLRAVLEEGLRLVLKNRRTPGSRAFRFPTFGKGGLNAEFRDTNWEKIRSAIYRDEGHKQS